ncbi:hypothetical protein PMAYCL1PPCAC_29270, partial [Pristionchus mayeri]
FSVSTLSVSQSSPSVSSRASRAPLTLPLAPLCILPHTPPHASHTSRWSTALSSHSRHHFCSQILPVPTSTSRSRARSIWIGRRYLGWIGHFGRTLSVSHISIDGSRSASSLSASASSSLSLPSIWSRTPSPQSDCISRQSIGHLVPSLSIVSIHVLESHRWESFRESSQIGVQSCETAIVAIVHGVDDSDVVSSYHDRLSSLPEYGIASIPSFSLEFLPLQNASQCSLCCHYFSDSRVMFWSSQGSAYVEWMAITEEYSHSRCANIDTRGIRVCHDWGVW